MSHYDDYSAKLAFTVTPEVVYEYDDTIGNIVIAFTLTREAATPVHAVLSNKRARGETRTTDNWTSKYAPNGNRHVLGERR
jgi:hypothetical protein